MCIYCGTLKYRKIYQEHIGTIPKDETGRSFEIHHKDGNRSNNKIENLIALSIQDHYDVHYSQKDWGACLRIAAKMKIPHAELSELARNQQQKRVSDGTHPFLNKEFQREQSRKGNSQRLANGTHNFLDSKEQSRKGKISSQKSLANGTHNFLGGDIQHRKIKNGTHHLLGTNRVKITCPHCSKEGDKNLMVRWHFDKCKLKP